MVTRTSGTLVEPNASTTFGGTSMPAAVLPAANILVRNLICGSMQRTLGQLRANNFAITEWSSRPDSLRPSPKRNYETPPGMAAHRWGFRGGGLTSSPAPLGRIHSGRHPSELTKHLQARWLTGGGSAGEDLRPHPRLWRH